MRFVYLHGFGSSGRTSSKAGWLREQFAKKGRELECPDLVPGDFSMLSLSGQLDVLEGVLGGDPCCLVGSSFGGLIAAHYAGRHPEVDALVLLAPAFGFPVSWVERMGVEVLEAWRESGWLEVYHHAENRTRRVHYGLYEDAIKYSPEPKFAQAAVIVHGTDDETVPIDSSREYRNAAPRVDLVEVAGGHYLDSEGALSAVWGVIESTLLRTG
jgi:pimeloyl-ACP methyl ester carboxylesterase